MVSASGTVNHHRRSIRLSGYDYASEGGYFITLVTHNRHCLFGKMRDGEMVLNDFGKIVKEEWFHTSKIRPNIELIEDEFVVMPNHIHGIIWIIESNKRLSNFDDSKTDDMPPVGAYCHTPQGACNAPLRSTSQTVGAIVRGFKGAVTRRINESRNTPDEPIWQRNYYEHIINSEKDYYVIAEYIENNPLGWEKDKEFVE